MSKIHEPLVYKTMNNCLDSHYNYLLNHFSSFFTPKSHSFIHLPQSSCERSFIVNSNQSKGRNNYSTRNQNLNQRHKSARSASAFKRIFSFPYLQTMNSPYQIRETQQEDTEHDQPYGVVCSNIGVEEVFNDHNVPNATVVSLNNKDFKAK